MKRMNPSPWLSCLAAAVAFLTAAIPLSAVAAPVNQAAAARCVEIKGALLQRPEPGQPWKVVRAPSDLVPGVLLVAVPEAEIDSTNGAVRLRMIADLARRLPEPVYESAITLHSAPDVDLDFSLDRGLVGLLNQKKEGGAKVRVRAADHVWEIHLEKPGTRVALALFGRHAPGMRSYIQDPTKPFKPDDAPTLDLYLLMLQGEAELTTGLHTFAMNAPPGPAVFHWSNIDGDDTAPGRLDELPEFVKPPTAEELKQAAQVYARARLFNQLPIDRVLAEALRADDPRARRMAVVGLCALDNVEGLVKAVNDEQHPDVRDNAIVMLRHWMGRKSGQEAKLYKLLTEKGKLTPAQAGGVIQLLHGFSEDEQKRPELYSTLIAYLKHDQLPVRELVRFHLYRLVPAGKDIPFDAAGPAEQRAEAIKKWKELIPEGELPPKPKAPPPAKP